MTGLGVTDVSVGSKTVLTAPKRHFRDTPINGHRQTDPACLKRANGGHERGIHSGDWRVDPALLCRRYLLQQRFRLLQVTRVETFSEPAVDRSEQFTSLLRLPLIAP
jgi:hypothetical protein